MICPPAPSLRPPTKKSSKPTKWPCASSTPLKIESSLVIHLGDDVNLSAFGLKSELQGDVTVTQNDQTWA